MRRVPGSRSATTIGRTPLAVADAEYKAEKADGLLNADLYQAGLMQVRVTGPVTRRGGPVLS